MNILGDSIWSKTGTSKKSKLNVGANNHLAMHFINNKRFVWETISFIEIFLPKGMKSTTDLCLDRRFSPWRAHSLSLRSHHISSNEYIYMYAMAKPHVYYGIVMCILIDTKTIHIWMKWLGRGRNNNSASKQFAWVGLWAIKSQQIYQWPKGNSIHEQTHTHSGRHFINRNMCLP